MRPSSRSTAGGCCARSTSSSATSSRSTTSARPSARPGAGRGAKSVAIVGYTNAGKSTLLNRLTDAGVLVEDRLFATLDATTRRLELPGGEAVLRDRHRRLHHQAAPRAGRGVQVHARAGGRGRPAGPRGRRLRGRSRRPHRRGARRCSTRSAPTPCPSCWSSTRPTSTPTPPLARCAPTRARWPSRPSPATASTTSSAPSAIGSGPSPASSTCSSPSTAATSWPRSTARARCSPRPPSADGMRLRARLDDASAHRLPRLRGHPRHRLTDAVALRRSHRSAADRRSRHRPDGRGRGAVWSNGAMADDRGVPPAALPVRPAGRAAASWPIATTGGCVDLSVGTPTDAPPDVVVAAMADVGHRAVVPALDRHRGVPRAPPPTWMQRRLGVTRATPAQVAACIGTKELVAGLPHWLRLRTPDRDTVLYPAVSYPSYEMGATLAGCRAVPVPARRRSGDIDLSAIDPADAERALCLWVNTPGQPRRRARRPRRRRGVGAGPRRARVQRRVLRGVHVGRARAARSSSSGTDGVVAVHSLSKRSNLAGVRAGFYAGDAELVHYLSELRKHAGFMVPGPVQAAAIAALGRRRPRRRAGAPATAAASSGAGTILAALGVDAPMPGGAFYLWPEAPDGDAWAFARRLAVEAGVLVSPGEFYGPAAAGHVRLAMVAPTSASSWWRRASAADATGGAPAAVTVGHNGAMTDPTSAATTTTPGPAPGAPPGARAAAAPTRSSSRRGLVLDRRPHDGARLDRRHRLVRRSRWRPWRTSRTPTARRRPRRGHRQAPGRREHDLHGGRLRTRATPTYVPDEPEVTIVGPTGNELPIVLEQSGTRSGVVVVQQLVVHPRRPAGVLVRHGAGARRPTSTPSTVKRPPTRDSSTDLVVRQRRDQRGDR